MPLLQKAMPTQAVMAATSTRKALGVRNVRMTMAGNVPIARDSIAATVRNVHIAATAPTARASILTRKAAKASKRAIVRVLIPVGRGTASNVVTARASIPTKRAARATSNALTVRASTPTRRAAKASNAPIARASIPIRRGAMANSSNVVTVRASTPTRKAAKASKGASARVSTPTTAAGGRAMREAETMAATGSNSVPTARARPTTTPTPSTARRSR